MPTFLRIKDWSAHENNRTRELVNVRHILLPTKFTGDGYTELLDHPNGAAHYGAWVACVIAAAISQVRRTNPALPPHLRGTLFRDLTKSHDSASLSRLTRIPASVFEEAIERLIAIGWMERIELPDIELQQLAEKCGIGAGLVRGECGKSATKVRGGGRGGSAHSVRNARAKASTKTLPTGISIDDLSFPESLDTAEARAAMDEWLQYKRTRGERYRKPTFAQKMLDEFQRLGSAGFVAAVNHSMGNNYAGLFPAKEHGNATGKPSPGKWYDAGATGVGDI